MYFLIMITWSYLKTSNVRKAVEHFPTHTRSKWHPQPVTFQRHWVLFAKALKCQNGKRSPLRKPTSAFSISTCLPSSEGGLRGEATCEMNQCASWPSQWLERLMVMLVWSPSVLNHAPAAGGKQPLLTLRSRLQILSMLRILSLCGVQMNRNFD